MKKTKNITPEEALTLLKKDGAIPWKSKVEGDLLVEGDFRKIVIGNGATGNIQLKVNTEEGVLIKGIVGGYITIEGNIRGDCEVDARVKGDITQRATLGGSFIQQKHCACQSLTIAGEITKKLLQLGFIRGNTIVKSSVGSITQSGKTTNFKLETGAAVKQTFKQTKGAVVTRNIHLDAAIGNHLILEGETGENVIIAGDVKGAVEQSGEIKESMIVDDGAVLHQGLMQTKKGVINGNLKFLGELIGDFTQYGTIRGMCSIEGELKGILYHLGKIGNLIFFGKCGGIYTKNRHVALAASLAGIKSTISPIFLHEEEERIIKEIVEKALAANSAELTKIILSQLK